VGLIAIDREGQLQITWDRNAPAVRQAVDATLEISDGGPLPQAITLDQAHLQNGYFSYLRQSERVDVKLTLGAAEGRQVRDVTTFLGKLPLRQPEAEIEARRQRDELAAQAAKLKTDLEMQAARTRKLERDLKTVQTELKTAQQRRMTNQIPDPKQ